MLVFLMIIIRLCILISGVYLILTTIRYLSSAYSLKQIFFAAGIGLLGVCGVFVSICHWRIPNAVQTTKEVQYVAEHGDKIYEFVNCKKVDKHNVCETENGEKYIVQKYKKIK